MKRLALLLLLGGCASATFDESKVVDLTYSFSDQSIYWPTANKFTLTQVAWGPNAAGEWYASNDFTASEHGGTHLDAPIHFAEGTHTTDEIPITQLMGPARVIDVRAKAADDRNYLVAPQDIVDHETTHGTIPPGSVVLINTGFGKYYGDPRAYLGTDVRGVIKGLSFPGISEEAALMLVDREIDLIGIDTASLDNGLSTGFRAHRVLNGANIPGLENVANLDHLPPTGATVVALPMKIERGTGGPCRIIAILP
ncbi:MAG: cyclase family protein [Planctomycetota bacterium]|jgi:kynurenine formamidase